MNSLIISLLYIYFFLICLPSLLLISTERTVVPFFAMLIVFLWGSSFFAARKVGFPRRDVYLGLFIISFLISLCFNPATHPEDWIALGTNVELAGIFVVTRTMFTNQRRIHFALGMLLVGLCFLATMTILDSVQLISLEGGTFQTKVEQVGMESFTRYGSLAGGVNRSSFYFGSAILLASGLLLGARSPVIKILLGGVVFLSALANSLTFSVSGLLALVAGFLILFSNRIFKEKFLSKRNAVVFLGLLVMIISAAHNPRLQEKYEQIRYMSVVYWGSTRGAAFLGALQSISQHPLLGVGPSQFAYEIADSGYDPFYQPEKIMAAHNTFLSVAGDSGLIGLLFFILFYLNVAVPSWRYYRIHRSHLSLILLSCLGAEILRALSMDLQRDKLFWVILGLNAAALNLSPQAEEGVMRRF
jgi:O-antigen ligase